MSLILIEKENLPLIKKSRVSIKNIEKIFLRVPYGVVLVVDDEKKLLGYYDVNHWNNGTALDEEIHTFPLWRNVSEITAQQLGKYVLYPIVDENNRVIQIYHETEAQNGIVSEQISQLMEVQKMGYNFKHFFDKTGCTGKRIAIFTDYHRLKASLQLGEIFSEFDSEINFEGVFIYSGYKGIVTENTFNLNCELIFINSLSELVDKGVEIVYFNAESYRRAANINYFKKAQVKCRDVRRAFKLLCNTCLTDYTIIKYKHYFKEKGIQLLTMAVPRSSDIGQKNGDNTPESLKAFLNKGMDADTATELYKIRKKFVKNMVKEGDLRYYKDIDNKLFNVISKCRYVPNQPADFNKTIYLVGPCIVAGLYVKDEDTLGAQLQAYYNQNGENIRIVALPISTEAHRDFYLKTVMSLEPEEGDIIVFVDQAFRFLRYDIDCIEECRTAVDELGRDIYYDIPSHCNHVLMKIIAKKLYDGLHQTQYNTSEYEEDYSKHVKKSESISNHIDRLSKNSELIKYKDFLRNSSISKKIINGAIVMNCNPFTKGHQYLIEYAASKVDYLYIFVVQEDKSYFKFSDRINLVEKGTAHIPNVKVIPSGKFIISSTTFSEYFDKANLKGTTIDTSMDVEIFGKHIAPVLDISVRFVGEEPLDPITNQYNQAMKKILPKYGIQLWEIPRKESDGKVISASRVRKCLEEKKWEEVKEIVPQTTYEFLYEKFSEK